MWFKSTYNTWYLRAIFYEILLFCVSEFIQSLRIIANDSFLPSWKQKKGEKTIILQSFGKLWSFLHCATTTRNRYGNSLKRQYQSWWIVVQKRALKLPSGGEKVSARLPEIADKQGGKRHPLNSFYIIHNPHQTGALPIFKEKELELPLCTYCTYNVENVDNPLLSVKFRPFLTAGICGSQTRCQGIEVMAIY